MSDAKNPTVDAAIDEIQAVFRTDAALQDAIGRLTMLGFDRADLSLPHVGEGNSNAGADNPNTDTDQRQLRALGGGMVGLVGAFAAGAAIVGTGGAAAPAVAAMAAGGIGSAAIMQGAQRGADTVRANNRDEAGAKGDLILAVHMRPDADAAAAERAMNDAGASRVVAVRRQDSGASVATASGWTG